MDNDRAKELLDAERARLQQLLAEVDGAGQSFRASEEASAAFDDAAESLTDEGAEDAIAVGLRDRLAAVDRAEQRLRAGTFGRSTRTGMPIPDERLEANRRLN